MDPGSPVRRVDFFVKTQLEDTADLALDLKVGRLLRKSRLLAQQYKMLMNRKGDRGGGGKGGSDSHRGESERARRTGGMVEVGLSTSYSGEVQDMSLFRMLPPVYDLNKRTSMPLASRQPPRFSADTPRHSHSSVASLRKQSSNLSACSQQPRCSQRTHSDMAIHRSPVKLRSQLRVKWLAMPLSVYMRKYSKRKGEKKAGKGEVAGLVKAARLL